MTKPLSKPSLTISERLHRKQLNLEVRLLPAFKAKLIEALSRIDGDSSEQELSAALEACRGFERFAEKVIRLKKLTASEGVSRHPMADQSAAAQKKRESLRKKKKRRRKQIWFVATGQTRKPGSHRST